MDHDLKYYNTYNQSIIIPKFFYNFKFKKNGFFIIEWIEFVSYFRKFVAILDFYILKSLIRNYYSHDSYQSSRTLIIKIIQNLNYFVYNQDHFEYFITFDSSIIRFRILTQIISGKNDFPEDKKKSFLNFIMSSLDILQEIIIIFEDNNIFYPKDSFELKYHNIEKTDDIKFIPFAGGLNSSKTHIKSFWISKTCVTNYQFLQFILNGGYLNEKYWSKEGLYWLKFNKFMYPKYWNIINSKWFINNCPIELKYNFPVENISYFEAEACAKYYDSRLPSEDEWNWAASNRNKTEYPFGLDLPVLFEISSEFSPVSSSHNSRSESMMELVHLYGNTWEYTSTFKNDKDITQVCLKGGDWMVPNFILNNSLKMYIAKDKRDYCSGFRIIKK